MYFLFIFNRAPSAEHHSILENIGTMIINRITKLIGIGAFLCCSLTIAAQKLRSVSAHSNMHHDLIASQRDMSDQIKVQETREFMNELLEDEQEPEPGKSKFNGMRVYLSFRF